MSDVLVKRLRKAADEIRAAGHNGWGNVCSDGAERIGALAAHVETVRNATIEEAAKVADKCDLKILRLHTKLSTIQNVNMASRLTSEQIASAIRALAPSGEGEKDD